LVFVFFGPGVRVWGGVGGGPHPHPRTPLGLAGLRAEVQLRSSTRRFPSGFRVNRGLRGEYLRTTSIRGAVTASHLKHNAPIGTLSKPGTGATLLTTGGPAAHLRLCRSSGPGLDATRTSLHAVRYLVPSWSSCSSSWATKRFCLCDSPWIAKLRIERPGEPRLPRGNDTGRSTASAPPP
jgi:hypothetical protein